MVKRRVRARRLRGARPRAGAWPTTRDADLEAALRASLLDGAATTRGATPTSNRRKRPNDNDGDDGRSRDAAVVGADDNVDDNDDDELRAALALSRQTS